MNWILENKEWIFSGIGVAILLSLLELLRNLKSRNKKDEVINRIAQRYVDILDWKIRGHSGVIGLIESGADHLTKNKHLLKVCEIIVQHGKPNPLTNWVLKYIKEDEVLKFVKWQAINKIPSTYYFNEDSFKKLIEKYKSEN